MGKSPSQAPGRGRGHVYSFCKDKRKKKKKTPVFRAIKQLAMAINRGGSYNVKLITSGRWFEQYNGGCDGASKAN